MKTNYLKFTPVLLVALAASSNASALSYVGSAPTNYQQYVLDTPANPTTLIADPYNTPLSAIIAGNAAAPGANTELFTTADGLTPVPGAYNAYTDNTAIKVGFINNNGIDLTLSSLKQSDWGSGSGSLFEAWTQQAYTTFSVSGLGLTLSQFQAAFISNGGEQRLSDPNISYVSVDPNGTTHVGLAGFFNAKDGTMPPAISAVLPNGSQISEIVKATWGNQTQYLWNMGLQGGGAATATGLKGEGANNQSFSGNFDFIIPNFSGGQGVNVPEPTEIALLAIGLAGFLGLRRKAVKV